MEHPKIYIFQTRAVVIDAHIHPNGIAELSDRKTVKKVAEISRSIRSVKIYFGIHGYSCHI